MLLLRRWAHLQSRPPPSVLQSAQWGRYSVISPNSPPLSGQRRHRAAVSVDHHFGSNGSFRTPPKGRGKALNVDPSTKQAENPSVDKTEQHSRQALRNPVGVQLLSPALHAQVFPPTTAKVPPVKPEALSLCQHHLQSHGLQPEQASTLESISFDLPPLQGSDLSQHFWTLGRQAAQPWLGMAHQLAAEEVFEALPKGVTTNGKADEGYEEEHTLGARDWLALDPSIRSEFRPRSPRWLKKPGWVRYAVLTSEDGTTRALDEGKPVRYPLEEDGALVFDIESMMQESQFAVMATAAGAKAWYAWLSPWLLQEGDRCHEKDHLIPFGPSDPSLRTKQPARLLVGHNVGFDRARIRDEYSLARGNIRFLDTMSLHVATRGISSPQRGAWIKYSKGRELGKMLDQSDVEVEKKEVIRSILGGEDVDEEIIASLDLEQLFREMREVESPKGSTIAVDSLDTTATSDGDITSSASLLWQDVTSKNSLVDVARLHCNIEISKEARDVFMDGTGREEIVAQLDSLLHYCATDVLVTQKVFRKVWGAFQDNCPNPATTAGVLGLGSAILPVDDEWIEYIKRCDEKYEAALNEVSTHLTDLAEQLRKQGTEGVSWDQAMRAVNARTDGMESMSELPYDEKLRLEDEERQRPKLWWETDRWASQLDWTPKKPKKDRTKTASVQGEDGSNDDLVPRWYRDKVLKSMTGLGPKVAAVPAILRLHVKNRPIVKRNDGKWVVQGLSEAQDVDLKGSPMRQQFLRKGLGFEIKSLLGPAGDAVLNAARSGCDDDEIRQLLRKAADTILRIAEEDSDLVKSNSQLSTLDWTPSERPDVVPIGEGKSETSSNDAVDPNWWPKWYWDLYKSATGQLELTIRTKIAPLLLCVTWQGCPLHHSREHGWVFRFDPQETKTLLTRQKPLEFTNPADQPFVNDIARTVSSRLAEAADLATGKDGDVIDPFSITPKYFKVPHLAGDDSNVGSPFSKGFLPLFEKGTMQSEHPDDVGRQAAKNALEMNAQCSYWIGVRDRVRQQMVVWDGEGDCDAQFPNGASGARAEDDKRKKGIILPQIIPMGTVTRRAIEKTWLTASNAKINRVGSELKALVKAPPGWCIVGADVDSQELWICSVMGDAQFGVHGATAIGWMTLEGSKSLGTDLHSKTASILGTSRNQAKVFNYSRIYGAGIRHSSQLLLKANPSMSSEEATRKAKELYANTKGKNTQRQDLFGRKFWYGGTESFVFNKLEEIALSDQPKTPALDCGVTAALSRKYLPKARNGRQGEGDYMPSRINWVVQSSGVDYLHLLITSMEHLITTYDIRARFMISVHDEVRYLAKEEDAHRVALALQISNLWTRAMFAHKLQMDDLPQGVAFFAQVDIDKVLRKEADDPCVTPSQSVPIPAGYAEDVEETLRRTNGGSLLPDGRSLRVPDPTSSGGRTSSAHLLPPGATINLKLPEYKPSLQTHRSLGDRGLRFLQAQASDNMAEISALEQRARLSEAPLKTADRASKCPTRSSSTSSLSRASGKRAELASKKDSPFGSTMAFHTSLISRLSETSALSPRLAAIIDKLPPRPVRWRLPFYKTREHRERILPLYRSLLRHCPQSYPAIRQMIRGLTRAKRHCTSPRQTNELVQRGDSLLSKFEKQRQRDEEVTKQLEEEERSLVEKHHQRLSASAFGRYLRSIEEEKKPIPRPSGALLKPSFANPPLLRFKPVQPIGITMMIFHRRQARQRRMERQHDNAELRRQIQSEKDLWERVASAVGRDVLRKTSGWADERPWLRPLEREMSAINQTYEREQVRSELVFPSSMLRYARRAKQMKQRWRRERNRTRKELQSQERKSDESDCIG